MNKSIVLTLLMLLSVTPSWADEGLDKALARFVAKESMPQSGEYQQAKYFKSLSQPMRSQGIFRVSADEFVWQQQTPIRNTLTLSDGQLINIDYRDQQQIIEGADPFVSVLSALLTVKTQQLAAFFTLNQLQAHCVELTPNQGPLSQVFALVTICGQTQVEQLRLDEHNGNRTEIALQFK